MRTIRMADTSDARDVLRIYGPVVAGTCISFETEVPTADEIEGRISATMALAPWLVLLDGGEVAGYAYASRHRDRAAYRWSVDVSVYVDGGHRRSGVGRALYTSLLALLRLQGFCAAHAGITLPNDASVGLHESLGFRPVGVYRSVGFKHGRWHDVGWWQLPLRDRAGDPPRILTPDELRRSPRFDAALAAGLDAMSR